MMRYLIVAVMICSLPAGAQSAQANILNNDLIQRQNPMQIFASNYIQTNVHSNLSNGMQHENYNPPAQQILNNVIDNNVGDAFENQGSSLVEQIASLDIPAIQFGNGNLSLNINLPKMNFRSIKLGGKSSSGKIHKSHRFVNNWAKLNRNMQGRFSFGRKLKIKVDNCFKW